MANLKHILYLLLFCKAVYATCPLRREKELLAVVSNSTDVAFPPNITNLKVSIPSMDIKKIKALLIRLKPLEQALKSQNTTYVVTDEEKREVKEFLDSILQLANETSILSVIQQLSMSTELLNVANTTGRRCFECFPIIKRLIGCALSLIGIICDTICGGPSRGGHGNENGYGDGNGYGMG